MNISEENFEEARQKTQHWQFTIETSKLHEESEFHEMMKKMLTNPKNKIFLIELLDQSFRSHISSRVANQLEYIFSQYEDINFFSEYEQLLIWLFRGVGVYVSSISIPLFIEHLRSDVSNIIIKGEDEALIGHIKKRSIEKTRVNINLIGEVVLGEEEATERINKYILTLANPYIDYISIKISTLFSQIEPLAHEWSVSQISSRLEKIYDAAILNTFTNAQGKEEAKFINLDMEEYRDVRLTIDVFKKTLSLDRFKNLYAGIVLQAYLPETLLHVKELATWAQDRVDSGGAPIKIRLVKGANAEMELTEASTKGWQSVTFLSKAESDANFKLIMSFLLDEYVSPYVRVGIASHNLFDQALANVLAKERGVEEYYEAEMLEGMSEAAYKTLKAEGINVVLYAPVVTKENFTNAIAYLVRRFDENTAEQNFLRHSFDLKLRTPEWDILYKSYVDSIALIDGLDLKAKRQQNRNILDTINDNSDNYTFSNASDTDFALVQNQVWAQNIKDKWQNIESKGGFIAKVVVANKEKITKTVVKVLDRSQCSKDEKVVVGEYSRASIGDVKLAIETAKEDADGFRESDLESRTTLLMKAAQHIENARADLIGVAAAEVGKVFSETDVEVSEAIDFLNFYPSSVKMLSSLEGVTCKAKGVVLVISPWNFPIAIAVGGIAAGLSAGNTVIFKPSSEAVLCAYRLCQCFWEAGVSKNVLQFVPSSVDIIEKYLIQSPIIDALIFTGGEKTAHHIIQSRPDIHISAETGGKDATIVTALADREQAVKNVIHSAFSNSGQKCSATSLLVLEKEVYEDETFKAMLKDAATSREVGSVWDFKNSIGRLSHEPTGVLKESLKYLEEHESWLIEPSFVDDNPYMLTPSIRWGTKVGDLTYCNELFGPVLSVMYAENLEEAIEIVNATGYGLTSGLESLDIREQSIFKEKLKAGNLYINRSTTGAIVLRQPFGGMGKSSIGSGKKAGGYNYVSQFMDIGYEVKIDPDIEEEEKESPQSIKENFEQWYNREFMQEHIYTDVRGEDNAIVYLPVKSVLLRLEEGDVLDEITATIDAIKMVGASLHISLPLEVTCNELLWIENNSSELLKEGDTVCREDEDTLIESMAKVERIRYLSPLHVKASLYTKVADKMYYIASDRFVAHGRIELMHYFIEQSISTSFHRYGNLGIRGEK